MIREIKVRFVPSTISPSDCQGRVVVMVDVLRASTTIIQAMTNGAVAVYPVAEIDESRQLASELGRDTLLGGERNGKIVEGFDFGNSPGEYSTDVINAKNLVLCTTNGTYTLSHCRSAQKLWIGAFVNLSSICALVSQHEKLLIACAGTNRKVTDEDVLFAGAVIQRLLPMSEQLKLDDAARIAASRWQSIQPLLNSGKSLSVILSESHGGQNLIKLGYDHDVEFCANIDSHSIVPELNLDSWIIRPALSEA